MNLKNRYWIVRHGKSKANEAGVIVSHPGNGMDVKYGLTEEGKEQASAAGTKLKQLLLDVPAQQLRIYMSPFSRAVETAYLLASQLGIHLMDPRLKIAPELRERYFGTELELTSHELYKKVWDEDAKDTNSAPEGDGESVQAVAARLHQFLDMLESSLEDHTIVLVSHGDTLSILKSMVSGTDMRSHREHGLGTAEVALLDGQ